MSLSFKDAKIWSKEDPEKRDWRDGWKYGKILRGLSLGKDSIIFDWGPDATPEQKTLLTDSIINMSKWVIKAEEILDNPPTDEEMKMIRLIKRLRLE